jgi:outer membrane protein TolC
VTTEVSDALDNCRNAICQINIFTSMAEMVQEQRNLIYSEYINGRETIARVNQAQSELVEARSSLALWEIQYHKAVSQFNAAIGIDSATAVDGTKKQHDL